ncbi:hypothetical protein [Geobacter sp. SVR]|uniref:hypothetical protein n=1 Tax=Geobacter sp. SVR TaxID=2495594 RepID=UPI00143EF7D9|nr:hypothetical protein [Geobacter sp. SVR]BCS54757.1 hypothetical protein GSVR_30650 [Geobacter sp. SVR]GCF86435.1 hypothetical protein GSbR_30350 [Geobacter sp. SVR]
MTEKFAREGLKHIGLSHFGSEWPETAIASVLSDLESLPEEAMIQATKRAFQELPPKFLPAIKKVVDLVHEEASKLFAAQGAKAEEHWSKNKERRGEETILSRNPNSKFMEHAQKAVLVMMDPDKTREEKLEVFRVMERAYPGIGYAHEGARLQAHWQTAEGI